MAYKLSELRALSDDELVRQHDEMAQHVLLSLNYYREEISRRETEVLNRRMERMTNAVWMTGAILLLTAVLLWLELIR
jgi:hypothetical protein